MVTLNVATPVSHVAAPAATVYLPGEHGDPLYADRSFPLVELFDGFPGSPATWLRRMHLKTVLDTLISSGRVAPFIAVMPVQIVASRHRMR